MRAILPVSLFLFIAFSGLVLAEDYYELLGVDKDADDRTIRKAFKKLAIKKHPDRNTVRIIKWVSQRKINRSGWPLSWRDPSTFINGANSLIPNSYRTTQTPTMNLSRLTKLMKSWKTRTCARNTTNLERKGWKTGSKAAITIRVGSFTMTTLGFMMKIRKLSLWTEQTSSALSVTLVISGSSISTQLIAHIAINWLQLGVNSLGKSKERFVSELWTAPKIHNCASRKGSERIRLWYSTQLESFIMEWEMWSWWWTLWFNDWNQKFFIWTKRIGRRWARNGNLIIDFRGSSTCVEGIMWNAWAQRQGE